MSDIRCPVVSKDRVRDDVGMSRLAPDRAFLRELSSTLVRSTTVVRSDGIGRHGRLVVRLRRRVPGGGDDEGVSHGGGVPRTGLVGWMSSGG